MKIKASIEFAQIIVDDCTITIPDAEVRRMVESVTQGAGEKTVCKKCNGTRQVVASFNDGDGYIGYKVCPCCKPSAEDSLAKARDINVIKSINSDGEFVLRPKEYEAKISAYESAIRERDEAIEKLDMEKVIDKTTIDTLKEMVESLQAKMSQMMTVEEFAEWLKDWLDHGVGTVHDFIRQKIKVRNEGKKPFDPGRETGGTD